MIKRSLIFILGIMLFCGITPEMSAQDNDYVMFETIVLTPDYKNLKTLSENMRNHNKKYHSEGVYNATVFNIASGPNSGKIIWHMGPIMFAHLDARPSDDGHGEDWTQNVLPYVTKIENGEYWREDDKLSNVNIEGFSVATHPILYVRYHEVEKGRGYSINGLFTQISNTVKAMPGDNPWGIYYNEFRQGDLGRHIATVGFMKNWAEMDSDQDFKATFLKVNGENSWQDFIDGMAATFSNSWDEIWTYDPKLSGDD
ncbi:MAG: hypothetical protein BM564_00830 [Bacteroidetes bacterium MedPE-SWsnd-G2]|nr:MAG: hypothetical protein BM564_00830 [Bacteroidetes bacterium MedPE-SWsnd-G2]